MTSKSQCSLYAISPPEFELDAFSKQLENAFKGGDIAAFQLRMPGHDADQILAACQKLMPICHANNTQFIVNDHADIAAQINADGLHIGESDTDFARARELLGPNKVIGVSCYDSTDRAITLASSGADYVSFGAFYPTTTKKPKATPSPDILRWWSNYSVIPCVAIGGITTDNCPTLIEQGADFLAVVSGIWNHEKGPEYAVHAFNQTIKGLTNAF